MLQDLGSLSKLLNVDRSALPVNPDDSKIALAKLIVTELSLQKDPWLLVYDNVVDANDVRTWIPASSSIHVIATSRSGNWPNTFNKLGIESLSAESAFSLFLQESGRDGSGQEKLINKLLEELDCLPLAIVCAGAWLRETPSTSVAKYRETLAERIKQKPDSILDYNHSVFAAISLSLDRLSRDAITLAQFVSYLSPDGFGLNSILSKGLFSEIFPVDEKLDALRQVLTPLSDVSAIERCISELRRLGLLQFNADGSFMMHRLTRLTIQETLKSNPGLFQTLEKSVDAVRTLQVYQGIGYQIY